VAGSFRFCSLSSSSVFGNSYYVETPDGVRLLLDCGVPLRRLERCLAIIGVEPSSVTALFITHGHRDHTAALDLKHPFAQRYRIPVYATGGFWRTSGAKTHLEPDLRRHVVPGRPVDLGRCRVEPFLKPHDAAEPVGYTVRSSGRALSIATDLGCVPESVSDAVKDSDYLILESNHDRDMELNSGRSRRLIERVLSDVGHLSNDQAARALSRVVSRRTRLVLLSHLSIECNTPDLALRAARAALSPRCDTVIEVAPPDRPSRVFSY
jgi:phosphoribosyl 1,2-cyclic phosphodiesterase